MVIRSKIIFCQPKCQVGGEVKKYLLVGGNQQRHGPGVLLLRAEGDEDGGALLLHGAVAAGRDRRLPGAAAGGVAVALRLLGRGLAPGEDRQDRGGGEKGQDGPIRGETGRRGLLSSCTRP